MRKIIFRGKRTDNGKWVYGDLLHSDDCGLYICPEFGHVRGPFKKVEFPFMGNVCVYEVDPKTVGQYVGRDDINGIRIYTGDIIKTHSKWEHLRNLFVIVVDNSSVTKDGLGHWWTQDTIDSEVVGTVHDNPELVGKKYADLYKHNFCMEVKDV
jgi:hypothetical protein